MFYTRFPRATRALLGLTALVAVGGVQTAFAQSTLFNIPSTDAVEEKKVYFEIDYFGQLPSPTSPAPRFDAVTPRVVAGVAKNFEVGANVSFFHLSNGGGTQDTFQPNAKYKFWSNDDKGTAASGGLIWYEPLNNRSVVDNFGLVYANFSAKFKDAKNARLTLGAYSFVADDTATFGTRGGMIAGFEQPVTSKVTVLADWISGVTSFGYLTPGVSITLPHNGLFNAGYSMGNDYLSNSASKNRGIFIYYGKTIG